MTAIATLTMNPALDLATATEAVVPGDTLRCDAPRYDPGGGGGINVARAVCILGGDAIAVFPAGGPTGLGLRRLLKRERVPHRAIPIAGQTRESFTVDAGRSGQPYRFVLPGPALDAHEQARCIERLVSLVPPPRYVVASGSLPPGLPPDIVGCLAQRVRALGARLILDTSGQALCAARGNGVYLVKPNLRELRDLLGREIHGEAEEVAAAGELIGMGLSEVVVLSLGARGALLVSAR